MVDILLCSLPAIELYLPPAASATLKGYLNTQGYTSDFIDLNLLMLDTIPNEFAQVNAYFSNEHGTATPDIAAALECTLASWVASINNKQFKWLGVSVFSQDSRHAALDLVSQLKDRSYKIVFGGMGVTKEFGDELLSRNLIDAYIMGEGEHALKNLLDGNLSYPGINSAGTQILDLDSLGFADYSDYALADYAGFYADPVVQITGSRGCVRNCTFCDINDHWPKFKFRSGEHISAEIIKIHKELGINNFYFSDSLINGSLSAYMKMCDNIANYNHANNAKITWGGQFIVRPEKGLPKDYYAMTAASGAFNLALGVETGSDRVRAHMRKGFTNVDLDAAMENFSKYKISCSYLIIIGYPNEMDDDFYDTLRMFKRYQKYAAEGIILGVSLGETMLMLAGSPVAKAFNNELVVTDKSNNRTWMLHSNPTLTHVERIKRRLTAELVLDQYGYNLISSDRNMIQLHREFNV